MIVMRLWHRFCSSTASLCVLSLWCLTACGPQLRTVPDAGVQLSGHWLMQNQEREQLLSGLQQVLQQAEARQQRRERREQRNQLPPDMDGVPPVSPEGAPGMGAGLMDNNWEQRERREQQQALMQAVVPSRTLRITQQSSSRIELAPESAALRHFEVGETSTLVTSYDTLVIHSGWQGSDFVVYTTGKEQGLKVTERYHRNGDELLVTVNLSMSGLSAQTLQAHYRLQ